MPMPPTTPERKPCGTCGEPRSINADGTVRHHLTENPEFQAGPDSRKCKGAGQLPAGAAPAEDPAADGPACRMCKHPVTLTGNGRARSHLTTEQTPRPCPGGSDFPLGTFPDMVGTTDGLVATLHAECEHRDVGQCYDCYGATAPSMADQLKTSANEPCPHPDYGTDQYGDTACIVCGVVKRAEAEPATNDDRPEASQFAELLKQGAKGAGTVLDRIDPAVLADHRTDEQKEHDAETSRLTREAVKILEQRSPEQKAETAARMDRTASAALGLPVDPELNHNHLDESGTMWTHPGTRDACPTPDCEAWRRVHPDGKFCEQCNLDTHRCPGCGTDVPHGTVACAECSARVDAEKSEHDEATCEQCQEDPDYCPSSDYNSGTPIGPDPELPNCPYPGTHRAGCGCPDDDSRDPADAWRTPDDLLAKMPEAVRGMDALRLDCVHCKHPVTPLVDQFGTDGRAAVVVWDCQESITSVYRKCRDHECKPDTSVRLGDLDEGDVFIRRGTLMRLTEHESSTSVLAEVLDGPHKGRTGELKNLNEVVERASCRHQYSPATDSVTGGIYFVCDHCGENDPTTEQETKECTKTKTTPVSPRSSAAQAGPTPAPGSKPPTGASAPTASPRSATATPSAPTAKAATNSRSAAAMTTDQDAAARFLGGGRPAAPAAAGAQNATDAAAQFLAGGSGSHGEDETKRDRYGRYLILHPDTGKEQAWTRATTFAKSISDTFALSQWGLRMALLGATKRPDIVARAHGKHVRADKKLLDDLTADLKNAAGDKVAANLGTAMHSFTELADLAWHTPEGPRSVMNQVPPDCREDVETYIRLLEETGLEPVPHLIEFTTVVKQYGVAGTSDNCYKVTKPLTMTTARGPVQLVPGEYVIGDKKTGADLSYGWQEIAIQLALYAQGLNTAGLWDKKAEVWEPDPLSRFDRPGLKVRTDVGVIVHLPVDKEREDPKQPTVYGLDLESGWNAAVLCERVRAWRKVRKLASPVMVSEAEVFAPVRTAAVPDVTTRTTVRPPTLKDKAGSVTSKGEASAVWQEAKAVGLPGAEVDALVALMQSRLQKLSEPAG